jgi:hypothetical protein
MKACLTARPKFEIKVTGPHLFCANLGKLAHPKGAFPGLTDIVKQKRW